jgi:hypothetical protein
LKGKQFEKKELFVILVWRRIQKRRLASAWLVTYYSHSFRTITFFKELIMNTIFQDRLNSLPLIELNRSKKGITGYR